MPRRPDGPWPFTCGLRKNVLARYDWLKRQNTVEQSLVEEFPDSMRDAVRSIQQQALPKSASHAAGSGED